MGLSELFMTNFSFQSSLRIVGAIALLSLMTISAVANSKSTIAIKFPSNSTVLFQGDSITEGGRWMNSQDPNHIFGQSYVYLIASASAATYPNPTVGFINRGISGNTVQDLTNRWQTDCIALKPTVLSILIGVNDLNGNVSPAKYESEYDALLAQTVKSLPNVHLVICEPFGLPVASKAANWGIYQAHLALFQDISKMLAKKYHAVYVPFQDVLNRALKRAPANYWIWDGIHPTYAGHQLLAEAWVKAVRTQIAKWKN